MSGKVDLQLGTVQQSLLNRKIKESVVQIIVYTEINSQLCSVHFDPEGLTATAAILQTVEKLNTKYKFGMIQDAQMYELYAAKKNGKRQNDLPAMESQQLITKTKIRKFHLLYLGKGSIGQETKQSISVIKSDFNIESKKKITKNGKRQTDSEEGFFSCFCIQKLK